MRYAYFTKEEEASYPLAILVPEIRRKDIQETYFRGQIQASETLILELFTAPGKKKTPVARIKEYIEEELAPALNNVGAQYVFCANGDYFKVLAGVSKIEPNMGYVLDSQYGSWKIVYVPNYRARFYDPERFDVQMEQAFTAVNSHTAGVYSDPGKGIIHHAEYPKSYEEIRLALQKLILMECPLSIDIETFDLKHDKAGIGTITFCWNKHEGIAFAVDYDPIPGATEAPFGRQVRNEPVRALLKEFFYAYLQKAIYHNIAFDAYVLVYQLFMTDILDTEGLLEGLEVMLRNWDCTQIITYLATNSCSGNKLGLKDNSQEFAGNYAVDEIKDITKVPLDKLLEYNLVDGLATWYVHEKHYQTMIDDDQQPIYEDVFRPGTKDIIQMQLTGLPLNMDRVLEVKEILEVYEESAILRMNQTNAIQAYVYHLQEQHVADRNAKLKKKQITMQDDETKAVAFNPNSPPQLQEFLYKQEKLPILGYTDSKQPATDKDTISALRTKTDDKDLIVFLNALLDYKAVNKILTSFIPAFENASQGPDGWHYLFGNFKIGGTISGRLSSSKPNMQNLPSNVFMEVSEFILQKFPGVLDPYIKKGKLSLGKLIKSCFQAPKGWLLMGLDFDSLEDRISALTTKDPNKLKVYTDGYDGHCLRAYSYFGSGMPDIDPNSVDSINSIAKKYPDERQASKVPTFLLTYGGTYMGIIEQTSMDKEKALEVEKSYHELYEHSDKWVDAKLEQATKDGYVTVAFGLRVRTPLLKQVIRKTSKTPYEAEAEGRTAGNALGQSWCLLNTRAGSEFMGNVRKSEFRLDIRPGAQIHDAQYFMVRDSIDAVLYTNEHLVKAVQWQDHPDIEHPLVKLGGGLSLFHPTWAEELEIPNNAGPEEIFEEVAKIAA